VLVSAGSHLGKVAFYTLMLNYDMYITYIFHCNGWNHIVHITHNGEIAYHGTLGETMSCCYIEIMVICKGWAQVWATILVKAPLVSLLWICFLYSGGDVRWCCTFCPKGGILCIRCPPPSLWVWSVVSSHIVPWVRGCLCVMQPWPLMSINLSCTTDGAPHFFLLCQRLSLHHRKIMEM